MKTDLTYKAFSRVLVLTLMFTLVMPLPMVSMAQGTDDGTARVHARLNSPERQASIAEAARKDAEMRAAGNSSSEATGTAAQGVAGIGEYRGHDRNSPNDRGESRTVAGITDRVPNIRQKGSADQPEFRDTTRNTHAATGDTQGDSRISVMSPAGAAPPNSLAPKSLSLILVQQAAALMGVPGPEGEYNQDEGLGFHQDGTARKAGGSASGSATDLIGRRSAAYSQYGLAEGYTRGLSDPGYDPITGYNWRIGDPTAGGRISGQNGMGRTLDALDPARAAMDRGLSYGLGFANSAGEAALSGLMDGGRARLNFGIDWNGRINGEGDVLYPFYDSQYTTIYTQLGARSMSGMNRGDSDDGSGADRWIGNAGIGQRWFPQAQSLTESGNWMLGYNAFYDYDFTRSHQRSGLGLEAQYDWLRVATNYYFPISSWRDSKDFDGDFVKERAAEGWDLRAKGYLPFYRNVAITGAYSQWFGEHVGMFSSAKLERDPKVWSYGLEYTPVPLVSCFVNQRSTEQGRSDTEFGLRFTYHFQMPLEDQISHAKVAELRTVSGSRHEFVDRENRIILEYKAKNNYRIEYVGLDEPNGFLFRVLDGFDNYIPGQTVRVTAQGAFLAEGAPAGTGAPQTLFATVVNFLDTLISVKAAFAAHLAKSYRSDSQGRFWVQLDPSAPHVCTVVTQVEDTTQTFTLNGNVTPINSPSSTYSIAFDAASYTSAFSGAVSAAKAAQTVTITVLDTANGNAAVSGATVTLAATMHTTNQAVVSARKTQFYGLQVRVNSGALTQGAASFPVTSGVTNASGQVTLLLEDIVGERTLSLTATVADPGNVIATGTAGVAFGEGPLAMFRLPASPGGVVGPRTQWGNTRNILNTTIFPAAALCGANPTGVASWAEKTNHSADTNHPTRAQFAAVSRTIGNGSGVAAGWPSTHYWTGELYTAFNMRVVYLDGDAWSYYINVHKAQNTSSVICSR